VGGAWRAIYQFGLEEQIDADYEMANWFTSTHPGSGFVQRLMVAIALPRRRLTLANNVLSVHHTGGPSERRTISDADELRRILEQDLKIRLPDDERLDGKLQKLVEGAG
jgi:N-hydroxyarylamine O-acetyltransferase